MATRKKAASAVSADERVRRTPGKGRGSRADEDDERVLEGGLVTTNAELDKMIRDEWTQEALPTPPRLKGFHMCWLSTTNQWDPIQRRVRFGYVPVRTSELKGFDYLKLTSGEYEGCVGINEMILFKIPEDRYQYLMHQFHHKAPLEEEEKIRARIDSMRDEMGVDKKGNPLLSVVGDGLERIVQRAKARPFE